MASRVNMDFLGENNYQDDYPFAPEYEFNRRLRWTINLELLFQYQTNCILSIYQTHGIHTKLMCWYNWIVANYLRRVNKSDRQQVSCAIVSEMVLVGKVANPEFNVDWEEVRECPPMQRPWGRGIWFGMKCFGFWFSMFYQRGLQLRNWRRLWFYSLVGW